ncbi:hypothetical protein [Herbidospora daliensis]|uniref:hypothetical protein n=1 Tax=Herbidospora daliensis TaxID=295585 RepID=UPI001E31E3DE|nr:hypothetical protein [Herbidospora daliensis]
MTIFEVVFANPGTPSGKLDDGSPVVFWLSAKTGITGKTDASAVIATVRRPLIWSLPNSGRE